MDEQSFIWKACWMNLLWPPNPTDPICASAAMLPSIGALEPLLLLAASTDIPLSDIAGLWELLDKLAPSGKDWVPPVIAVGIGPWIDEAMLKLPTFVKPRPMLLGSAAGMCGIKLDADIGGGIMLCWCIIGGMLNPSFSNEECSDDGGRDNDGPSGCWSGNVQDIRHYIKTILYYVVQWNINYCRNLNINW